MYPISVLIYNRMSHKGIAICIRLVSCNVCTAISMVFCLVGDFIGFLCPSTVPR